MNRVLSTLFAITLFGLISANEIALFNTSCFNEATLIINAALDEQKTWYNDRIQINSSNWLEILKSPLDNRKANAFSYSRCNYMTIYEKRDFISLDIETFKELLSSDILEVSDETIVFESIVEWIKHNCFNIENHLSHLMHSVRFPQLSLKYIWEKVKPYANSFEKSRQIFLEAVRWHIFPEEQILPTVFKRNPRKSCINKFACLGGNTEDINVNKIIDLYDPTKNKWSTKILDLKKTAFGLAVVDQQLLFIGGYLKDANPKSQKSVDGYDFATGKINSLHYLNEARFYPGIVTIKDDSHTTLYAIGGWGINDAINSVERWDSVTKNWKFVSPMRFTRSGSAVALFKNKIYVVGGRTVEHGYTTTAEIYDISKDSWDFIEPTPYTIAYGVLVANSRYLYYMGGSLQYTKPHSKVIRYDPEKSTWTPMPDILSSGMVGGFLLKDNVVVVGGTTYDVQAFDEEKNQWKSLAPLTSARQRLCTEIPVGVRVNW